MQKSKYVLYFILLVCVSVQTISAQNHTKSPYSRFGIGDIGTEAIGMQTGMGNIGAGFRYRNAPSISNPASYSTQDTLSFIAHFGGFSRFTKSNSFTDSDKDWTVNLNHLIFSYPLLNNRWYSIMGIMPYTSVGYNLVQYGEPDLELGTTVDRHNKGNGGLNRLIWGHSFMFGNLSLGANVSWLFGTLSYENITSFPFDANAVSVLRINDLKTRGFHFNTGAQYTHKINEKNSITGGLTYEIANKLKVQETSLISYNNTAGYMDTVSYIKNQKKTITLPSGFGIGAFYNNDERWFLGLDYSFRKWSDADLFFSNEDLSNVGKISVGAQYIPLGQRGIRNKYYQRVSYRAGAYLSESYFSLQGEKPKQYGLTVGLGLPFRRDNSVMNIAYSLESRGTDKKNLLHERIHIVSINVSLYDFWFLKRKWD